MFFDENAGAGDWRAQKHYCEEQANGVCCSSPVPDEAEDMPVEITDNTAVGDMSAAVFVNL